MERFEIAKTEEEREEDYQRIIDFLKRNGIKDSLKISDIIVEKKEDFGINNVFPKLSEKDEAEQNQLFAERALLIEKYEKLRKELLPLLAIENQMWQNIVDVNDMICELEGHRLSIEAEWEYDIDDYGHYHKIGYYRTCLVCGKRVYETNLTARDVVVKGKSGPKRILYQNKK